MKQKEEEEEKAEENEERGIVADKPQY